MERKLPTPDARCEMLRKAGFDEGFIAEVREIEAQYAQDELILETLWNRSFDGVVATVVVPSRIMPIVVDLVHYDDGWMARRKLRKRVSERDGAVSHLAECAQCRGQTAAFAEKLAKLVEDASASKTPG